MISKINQPLFGSPTTSCNTPAELSAMMITAFSGALICGQWENKTVRICATLCALNSLIVIVALASFKREKLNQQKAIDLLDVKFNEVCKLAERLDRAIEVFEKEEQKKSLQNLADAFQKGKEHCKKYVKEAEQLFKKLNQDNSSS